MGGIVRSPAKMEATERDSIRLSFSEWQDKGMSAGFRRLLIATLDGMPQKRAREIFDRWIRVVDAEKNRRAIDELEALYRNQYEKGWSQ